MPAADPLAELLAGSYRDPDSGDLLAAAARSVAIEPTLDGAEPELLAALGLGPRVAAISDATTVAVLGERVERALASRFVVQRIVLERDVRADRVTIARLVAALDPRCDAVVAIGSGTLNDLCKMVALERGLPQVVFATAPSMNGYTSLSASIVVDGLKRSFRAATPVGAFFDLRVLAAAPPRLIQAGLGDSLCRSTAQADWGLAQLVLGRAYREAPFALLADDEAALVADPTALLAGDLAAMRHLVRTLVLSGFGMTICGGSFPASQGEHLISHYVELMGHAGTAFHGEQIAVASVVMAELQERIVAIDRPVLVPSRIDRAQLVDHFGATRGEQCWADIAPKRIDDVVQLNARLATGWSQLRDRIARRSLGAARLRAALATAGAPTAPEQLGWSPALVAAALIYARALRDRYTFLDLAGDLA
jgi:glycerol-1-phosphate dehydrogenase [NAD(P)+]